MDAEIKTRKNILQQNKNISKFIIDETQIKVGKDYFWLLWVVAIKPKDKYILHIHICQQKETHVCCRTFSTFFLVKKYGKYPISIDDETLGIHRHVNS